MVEDCHVGVDGVDCYYAEGVSSKIGEAVGGKIEE